MSALMLIMTGSSEYVWALQLTRVGTVANSNSILVERDGIDTDHDGRLEFVLQREPSRGILDVVESTPDDFFANVFTLDLTVPGSFTSYGARDARDGDNDGLTDYVVSGRTGNEFYLRVYESQAPTGFPSSLVWQATGWYWFSGPFADFDGDGSQEIIFLGQNIATGIEEFGAFENTADNSYELVAQQPANLGDVQSLIVTQDLDGDGRDEVLYGGLTPTTPRLFMLESDGDNSFEESWTWEMVYPDGALVNASEIVDGGDLDGDGRKEFLAGGLKTISAGGPTQFVFVLFEAVADDTFEIVATFAKPMDLQDRSSVNVADLDGDGRREIIVGAGPTIWVYENVGDNSWAEIGSFGGFNIRHIYAGDHDRDGKDELIIREAGGFTGIWEIDPAEAADVDSDGTVDAIDNCLAVPNPDQSDLDGDSIGDVCDNCIHAANPDQGSAPFGQVVVAFDPENFTWNVAAPVIWARGGLASVSSYTTDLIETQGPGIKFTDLTIPAPGTGFFYLVRPDCPVGSWQTSPGAEPARDGVLP